MTSLNSISQAVQRFIQDLMILPVGQPIDDALEGAASAEHELRLLFGAGHQIEDPFLGLVNIFSLHPAARRTRARHVPEGSGIGDKFIFPLNPTQRRRDFMPSTVFSIEAFQRQWDIFTHGALSKMRPEDWENVVAAGGSVLASLMPPSTNSSERRINDYFQSSSWASSDIDLFLWGLSPDQAEEKMQNIYKAVCASAPRWRVVCVRRAKTISIHTTYPYRPLQIILRLYQSPAQILTGFDVDAACLLYNGKDIWASPRAVAALVRQANTVDVTRRSPSYEVRLAKYAERGFEVFVPSLNRGQIKETLYDSNLRVFPNGLARLLVLEAAYCRPSSYTYLRYPRSNDTTLPRSIYEEELSWAPIPYGPKWDAKKIKNLILRKDAFLNEIGDLTDGSQAVHRHIFFVGTMRHCLRPVCEECGIHEEPSHDEREQDPSEVYIRGPICFIRKNPGDQLMTGSFRPMNLGDWEAEAYERHNPRVVIVDSDGDNSDGASEYADPVGELFA